MKRSTLMVATVLLALSGVAHAGPLTSVSSVQSSGGQLRGIYAFGEAADTVQLNMISPSAVNNIFCNHSGAGCTGSSVGQSYDLGQANGNLSFSINNLTTGNIFNTNQLASDGFAHALISQSVDAGDPLAVAAAYALYGMGELGADAAAAIASAAATAGSLLTFVGWEDTLSGDFDYNDLVFAFVDSPVLTKATDPGSNFVQDTPPNPDTNEDGTPPAGNDEPPPSGNAGFAASFLVSNAFTNSNFITEVPEGANGVPEPEGFGLAAFLGLGLYAFKRRKKVSAGS